MSFRFQKRIKMLPGLRLNVSKTGISWTLGTRGASVTARDGKLTGNVGLPGTGLSYRKRLDLPDPRHRDPELLENLSIPARLRGGARHSRRKQLHRPVWVSSPGKFDKLRA